ncbi:MAG TPA: PPC domain-containing DNA-binding protein [Actinomycetota bacterium]
MVFQSDDGRSAMWRVPEDADLLESVTQAVTELGVSAGSLQVIGAVKKVVLGYYDQDTKQYGLLEPEGHFEIASGLGSVSMKDGAPFVHLHLVCSGEDGASIGGHLMPGTITFVAEATVTHLGGPAPERVPDASTGLALWPAG